jgi:gephyrin
MPPSSNQKLKAAILIISDTAHADNSTDKAGPTLEEVFTTNQSTSWEVAEVRIVPDEVVEIQRCITQWCDKEDAVNCVVTSGGTGFARRDLTPEVSEIFEGVEYNMMRKEIGKEGK